MCNCSQDIELLNLRQVVLVLTVLDQSRLQGAVLRVQMDPKYQSTLAYFEAEACLISMNTWQEGHRIDCSHHYNKRLAVLN